mmetsp:Transcript_20626/g.30736  ORF Transcript_20626/g.30736 Transcript_20626/m.30736 type:complete len:196 (-) Transcript_20626:160-747(-)
MADPRGGSDDAVSVRSQRSTSSSAARGHRSQPGTAKSRSHTGANLRNSASLPQLSAPPVNFGNRKWCAAFEAGNAPAQVIVPGYTGFIPGKNSENILSSTHQRANLLAAQIRRGASEPECDFARRSNAYGLLGPRRGADVPGYCGFIPAKHAANVYGASFAESNRVAQLVRREQALHKVHRPPINSFPQLDALYT